MNVNYELHLLLEKIQGSAKYLAQADQRACGCFNE